MTDNSSSDDNGQGRLPFPARIDAELQVIWHSDCDEALRAVLRKTQGHAAAAGQTEISLEHLLLALTATNAAATELRAAGVDVDALNRALVLLVHSPDGTAEPNSVPRFVAHSLASVLLRASARSREECREVVGLKDIVAALRELVIAPRTDGLGLQALSAHWASVHAPDPFALIAAQIAEFQSVVFSEVRALQQQVAGVLEKVASTDARTVTIATEVASVSRRLQTVESIVTAVGLKAKVIDRRAIETSAAEPVTTN